MMNSSTGETGGFASNPFRSGHDPFAPAQQQQQQQQPQQQPQQQGADPLNFATPPTNTGGFVTPPPVSSGPTNAYAVAQPMPAPTTGMAPAPVPTDRGIPTGAAQPTPQQAQQAQQPQSRWEACMACLTLDTYKAYFDIDTEDVVLRLKSALLLFYLPDRFRSEVVGVVRDDNHKGPDLYGPLWVTMTLVFFVAFTANMSAFFRVGRDAFEVDINHLTKAMSLFFSFVFCVPAVLWIATQCLGMQALLLVDWICLYGYSMVPYFPATLLCIIPFQPVIFAVLALATAMSVLLVIRNSASALLGADAQANKAGPLLLAVLAGHVVLFFILKFGFY